MDLGSIDIWYWVILLLFALIFGIVGFFIGKSKGNAREVEAMVEELKLENSQLQTQLDSCQQQLNEQSVQISQDHFDFDSRAAASIFGRTVRQDDLQIVEGIGPKIEGLFHNYNIKTWKALSKTSVSKCIEVLQSGGEKYRVHDPASWPMQAKMCYEGKWKELYRWQVEHKHGKL